MNGMEMKWFGNKKKSFSVFPERKTEKEFSFSFSFFFLDKCKYVYRKEGRKKTEEEDSDFLINSF